MKKAHLLPFVFILCNIFSVQANIIPSTPVLNSPKDESITIPNGNRVQLNWSIVTDSNGDAITYDLYFGDTPDPPLYRENLYVGWSSSDITEASYNRVFTNGTFFEYVNSNSVLSYETTYYWKVVAKNGLGEEKASTIFSFTTSRENKLPSPPVMTSPTDNEINVLATTKLEWTPSIDQDGDPVTYNVYFGSNSTNPFAQPPIATGLTTTSYSFAQPLKDQQTYFWRVGAVDGYSGQIVTHDGTTNTWRFTVENYIEDPPVSSNLISPEDEATNVSFEVKFKWDPASDKDSTPLIYDLYADQTPNPQTLIATNLTSTTYTHTFSEYGLHYWRVVVKDGTGLTDDYPTFSFTTWDEKPNFNIEMVDVEGGRFTMGQTDSLKIYVARAINGEIVYYDASDEGPEHEVFLDDYKIGKYEVINQQYVSFLNAIVANTTLKNSPLRSHPRLGFKYRNVLYKEKELCQVFDATRTDRPVGYDAYDSPIIWNGTSFELDPRFEDHPVRFMYYEGALLFTKWLGKYRLPTEAEWEYAAMGGRLSKGYRYSGSNNRDEVGVNNINGVIDVIVYTSTVGSLLPNELGIYDMSGNVQEICEDLYYKDYYATSPVNNPVNTIPQGFLGHSIRGGAYTTSFDAYFRVKVREYLAYSQYIESTGIRLATSVEQPKIYGINGKVLDVGGDPLVGVRLNGFTNIVETDVNGNYSATEASGWSGTITPQLSDHSFSPTDINITNLQADDTGNNFTGTAVVKSYTVSGKITDVSGNPLANVTIDGFTNTVVTDANGKYSATEASGWSGTITPQLSDHSFSPTDINITNLQADDTGNNFTGTAVVKSYTVSGKITDVSGNPLANVTIDGFTNTVVTDANGKYSATEASGWSGTVTPQIEGYLFTPLQYEIENLENDVQKDFESTKEVILPSNMIVYPNPSSNGIFSIEMLNPEYIKEINIYSAQGLIYQVSVNKTVKKYTMENALQSGFYVIEVITNKGVTKNKILIN